MEVLAYGDEFTIPVAMYHAEVWLVAERLRKTDEQSRTKNLMAFMWRAEWLFYRALELRHRKDIHDYLATFTPENYARWPVMFYTFTEESLKILVDVVLSVTTVEADKIVPGYGSLLLVNITTDVPTDIREFKGYVRDDDRRQGAAHR